MLFFYSSNWSNIVFVFSYLITWGNGGSVSQMLVPTNIWVRSSKRNFDPCNGSRRLGGLFVCCSGWLFFQITIPNGAEKWQQNLPLISSWWLPGPELSFNAQGQAGHRIELRVEFPQSLGEVVHLSNLKAFFSLGWLQFFRYLFCWILPPFQGWMYLGEDGTLELAYDYNLIFSTNHSSAKSVTIESLGKKPTCACLMFLFIVSFIW